MYFEKLAESDDPANDVLEAESRIVGVGLQGPQSPDLRTAQLIKVLEKLLISPQTSAKIKSRTGRSLDRRQNEALVKMYLSHLRQEIQKELLIENHRLSDEKNLVKGMVMPPVPQTQFVVGNPLTNDIKEKYSYNDISQHDPEYGSTYKHHSVTKIPQKKGGDTLREIFSNFLKEFVVVEPEQPPVPAQTKNEVIDHIIDAHRSEFPHLSHERHDYYYYEYNYDTSFALNNYDHNDAQFGFNYNDVTEVQEAPFVEYEQPTKKTESEGATEVVGNGTQMGANAVFVKGPSSPFYQQYFFKNPYGDENRENNVLLQLVLFDRNLPVKVKEFLSSVVSKETKIDFRQPVLWLNIPKNSNVAITTNEFGELLETLTKMFEQSAVVPSNIIGSEINTEEVNVEKLFENDSVSPALIDSKLEIVDEVLKSVTDQQSFENSSNDPIISDDFTSPDYLHMLIKNITDETSLWDQTTMAPVSKPTDPLFILETITMNLSQSTNHSIESFPVLENLTTLDFNKFIQESLLRNNASDLNLDSNTDPLSILTQIIDSTNTSSINPLNSILSTNTSSTEEINSSSSTSAGSVEPVNLSSSPNASSINSSPNASSINSSTNASSINSSTNATSIESINVTSSGIRDSSDPTSIEDPLATATTNTTLMTIDNLLGDSADSTAVENILSKIDFENVTNENLMMNMGASRVSNLCNGKCPSKQNNVNFKHQRSFQLPNAFIEIGIN